MSYGVGDPVYRLIGSQYVAPILPGHQTCRSTNTAASTFNLVINLKTAKALGLQIPDKLLAIANEVIE